MIRFSDILKEIKITSSYGARIDLIKDIGDEGWYTWNLPITNSEEIPVEQINNEYEVYLPGGTWKDVRIELMDYLNKKRIKHEAEMYNHGIYLRFPEESVNIK